MDIRGIGYSVPGNTKRSEVKLLRKKEIVARTERQRSCMGKEVERLQARE
jgi:cation transport regulator ChaC